MKSENWQPTSLHFHNSFPPWVNPIRNAPLSSRRELRQEAGFNFWFIAWMDVSRTWIHINWSNTSLPRTPIYGLDLQYEIVASFHFSTTRPPFPTRRKAKRKKRNAKIKRRNNNSLMILLAPKARFADIPLPQVDRTHGCCHTSDSQSHRSTWGTPIKFMTKGQKILPEGTTLTEIVHPKIQTTQYTFGHLTGDKNWLPTCMPPHLWKAYNLNTLYHYSMM